MTNQYADLVARFGDVIHEIPELGPAILQFEAREKNEAAVERPRYHSGASVTLSDRHWGEVQSVVGCVFRPPANAA